MEGRQHDTSDESQSDPLRALSILLSAGSAQVSHLVLADGRLSLTISAEVESARVVADGAVPCDIETAPPVESEKPEEADETPTTQEPASEDLEAEGEEKGLPVEAAPAPELCVPDHETAPDGEEMDVLSLVWGREQKDEEEAECVQPPVRESLPDEPVASPPADTPPCAASASSEETTPPSPESMEMSSASSPRADEERTTSVVGTAQQADTVAHAVPLSAAEPAGPPPPPVSVGDERPAIQFEEDEEPALPLPEAVGVPAAGPLAVQDDESRLEEYPLVPGEEVHSECGGKNPDDVVPPELRIDSPTEAPIMWASRPPSAGVPAAAVPPPPPVPPGPPPQSLPLADAAADDGDDRQAAIKYTCRRCGTTGLQTVDKIGSVVSCSHCGKAMRLSMPRKG